jgi:class 3 adenylate cyclase
MARSWARYVFPDSVDDAELLRHFASWMRDGGAPGDIVALLQVDMDTDVRDILPTIGVPTLVIHRVEDRSAPIAHGRFIAEHLPGATLVELPGNVHGWPDQDDFSDAVVRFLEQLNRESAEFDRVLATVLFTDMVGSTQRSAALGDRGWRDLVERHHALVRGLLARYRGTEIDTAGDGFFATFDGPARAVRCAEAIVDAVRGIGLEVRTGVHTGEVETIDTKVGGIAVNIGARIGAIAEASEVLVSSTVKDLTAGSGLVFEDAGEHELKGIPDRWRLYRVAD